MDFRRSGCRLFCFLDQGLQERNGMHAEKTILLVYTECVLQHRTLPSGSGGKTT